MSDDEIKHELDKPVEVSTNDTDSTAPTEVPQFDPVDVDLHIVEPKPVSHKGRFIGLALLALVFLGGGSAFAYYMIGSSATKEPVAASPTPTPSVTPKPAIADAVLYQTTVFGKNTADCGTSSSTLYRQPLSSAKPTKILDIPDYQGIANQITRDNLVAIETTAACASKTGSQIWISEDSGSTFVKLYELPSKSDSITSMQFSSDGKYVIIGSLPNVADTNTVKAVEITTQKVKDLFTVNKQAVYLQGYDTKNQKVYYYTGPCYGCDAGKYESAWVYELAKKTESKLFDVDANAVINDSVMSTDMTKILRLEYTGTTSPKGDYVVNEYSLASKKIAPVAKFTKTTTSNQAHVGYTNDGNVYYSFDKTLSVVNSKTGTSSIVMTPTDTLANVYYVDKDKAIVELGDYTVSAHVVLYDITAKTTTKLVDYKYPSTISGVVLK